MSLTQETAEELRNALATVVVVPVTPLGPTGPRTGIPTRSARPAAIKEEIAGILDAWGLK